MPDTISKPLNPDCWEYAAQHIEANLRASLTSSCPSLLTYFKRVPMKIDKFQWKRHEFTLNKINYLFKIFPFPFNQAEGQSPTVEMVTRGPDTYSLKYREGHTLEDTIDFMVEKLFGRSREILVKMFSVTGKTTVLPEWVKFKVQVLNIHCEYPLFNEVAGHVIANDPDLDPLDKVVFQVYQKNDTVFECPWVLTAKDLHITFFLKDSSIIKALSELLNPKIHVDTFWDQITHMEFFKILESWLITPRANESCIVITKCLTPHLRFQIRTQYRTQTGYIEEIHNKESYQRPCICIKTNYTAQLKIYGFRHEDFTKRKMIGIKVVGIYQT